MLLGAPGAATAGAVDAYAYASVILSSLSESGCKGKVNGVQNVKENEQRASTDKEPSGTWMQLIYPQGPGKLLARLRDSLYTV